MHDQAYSKSAQGKLSQAQPRLALLTYCSRYTPVKLTPENRSRFYESRFHVRIFRYLLEVLEALEVPEMMCIVLLCSLEVLEVMRRVLCMMEAV